MRCQFLSASPRPLTFAPRCVQNTAQLVGREPELGLKADGRGTLGGILRFGTGHVSGETVGIDEPG